MGDVMIYFIPFALFCAFVAGSFIAYVYVRQESDVKLLRLQIELNTLEARRLPPRVLEIWQDGPGGGRHGVYLRAIDADLAVEALALVAERVRTFSEAGMNGVLTRRQLSALRGELLEAGYATWASSDRRQGINWTAEGEKLLETCRSEAVRARAYTVSTVKKAYMLGWGRGKGYV